MQVARAAFLQQGDVRFQGTEQRPLASTVLVHRVAAGFPIRQVPAHESQDTLHRYEIIAAVALPINGGLTPNRPTTPRTGRHLKASQALIGRSHLTTLRRDRNEQTRSAPGSPVLVIPWR